MKRINNLGFLISLSLLLSCTNLPGTKNSVEKQENISDTAKAAVNEQDKGIFTFKTVLSGKTRILLPEKFKLMDAEMLTLKYPQTGHQPTEVYTNEDGTINFALNYTQNKADEKDLVEVKETMERQFNQPTIDFIRSGIQEINGRKYIRLEFISHAANSKIYNLLQVTSLEGRLAMFTFNCTENYRKEWEAIGKKIMQSIEMK